MISIFLLSICVAFSGASTRSGLVKPAHCSHDIFLLNFTCSRDHSRIIPSGKAGSSEMRVFDYLSKGKVVGCHRQACFCSLLLSNSMLHSVLSFTASAVADIEGTFIN